MKELLREFGDPTIEDVHNSLADALKYLSDNYSEAATDADGKSVCMVNSTHILETLNALTVATVWFKVNRENFKNH